MHSLYEPSQGSGVSIMFPIPGTQVQLAAGFFEDPAHLLHSGFGIFRRSGGEEAGGFLILLRREIAHVLRDLHAAEFRPAHAAEMRGLGAFGREGLVVILLGRLGIEAEVELVPPAELEARA